MSSNSSKFHMEASSSGFHFVNLFQCCPRKFYMRYVKGWKPKWTAKPLVLGGAFHEGKATFYLKKKEKEAVRVALEYCEECKSQVENKETYEDILYRVENLLHYWIERVGKNDLIQYKAVEVEQELVVPIEGTQFKMTMRPDAILMDKGSELVLILETKTSGFSHRLTSEAVYYGDQATAYLWGTRKMRPKLNPYAVMPDVAYWNKTTRDVNNIQFIRSDLVFRNEYQTEMFENAMKQLFTEVTQKAAAIKAGHNPDVLFPRNCYYCLSYGQVCEYAGVCQQDVKRMRKVPDGMKKDLKKRDLGQGLWDQTGIVG